MDRPRLERALRRSSREEAKTHTFLDRDGDAVYKAPSSTKKRQRVGLGGEEWGNTCFMATLRKSAEMMGERQSPFFFFFFN